MKQMDSYADRICTRCGVVGNIETFTRRSDCPGKLQSWCRGCINSTRGKQKQDPEYIRQWRKNNPDKMKVYYRRCDLKRKYGITIEEYDALLLKQGGSCAICKAPPPEAKALAVDHDHETGGVRSLLCAPCNVAVGMLKESPARAKALAFYLESWLEWKSLLDSLS